MTAGTALIDPQVVFQKIHLGADMRVADFGCGRTGQFIFLASKIVGDKGIVYAVDIIKDVLEDVKSRARFETRHNIQSVWSDIEKYGHTPVPAQSLDAAILTNVIFLVKDKLAVLRELARLTKPEGYVIVIDWIKRLGPLGPAPEMLVKPEIVIELAKQAELTLLEQSLLNDNHYCLIFKKIDPQV